MSKNSGSKPLRPFSDEGDERMIRAKTVAQGVYIRCRTRQTDWVLTQDPNDAEIKLIILCLSIAKHQEVQVEIIEKGRQCGVFPGDISGEEDVKRMVEGVVNTLGGLMCMNHADRSSQKMVANAGACPTTSVLAYTEEQRYCAFAINTRGAFLCCEADDQIGSSADDVALRGDDIGYPRLNPGLLVSRSINMAHHGPCRVWNSPRFGEGNMDEVIKLPEDVTELVSYLASKEARYMTGASLSSGRQVFMLGTACFAISAIWRLKFAIAYMGHS
ncbi:hypothetical protein F5146DRAFT_997800 [Armillaria mellea]|nr:hypothetical protein F5146DRAFT_997800 [Armillaria mellea]